MHRILQIALMIVVSASPVFGAIYPPSDYSFPCFSYTLVEGQSITGTPISVQMAKNEHYLMILRLFNSEINSLQVRLNGPSQTSTAWYHFDVFQLRAVPENMSDSFLADGLVTLDSGLTVQGNPNYLAVRFQTNQNHPQGTFTYTLSLTEGTKSLVVPLQVKVWSFALPSDLDLTIEAWFDTDKGWWQRYGQPNGVTTDIAGSYLAAFREYKINAVANFYGFPANNLVSGGTIEEYTDFTKMLDDVINKYNFRYFRLPQLDGIYDAKNVGTSSDLFSGVAPAYYQTWYNYLSPKGWAGKALVKLWDEPSSQEFSNMIQADKTVKNAVPAFKTETASWYAPTTEMLAGMAGAIDHFAIYNPAYNASLAESVQNQGTGLWLYANRRHGIEFPPTHQRSIGWYLFQYHFTGYYFWDVNYWVIDPWINDPGDTDYYRRGTFFYPHPTLGTPIPTLRLEAVRRGFEDYQYLKLLQTKKNRISATVWNDLQNQIAAVIQNWQDSSSTWPSATNNAKWSDYEAVRIKIGTILNNQVASQVAAVNNLILLSDK